jgi:hypothetical protein
MPLYYYYCVYYFSLKMIENMMLLEVDKPLAPHYGRKRAMKMELPCFGK